MDFLRTAYSTTFKWNIRDPHTSTVRWYRSPPGALLFPGQHRFCSSVWSRQIRVESAYGERLFAPRTYDLGATPPGILGSNFCGQASAYRDGAVVLANPIPSRPDGEPACCDGPGGIVQPCCPGVGLPTNMTLKISNRTGTCGCLPSQVLLTWDGFTQWSGVVPGACGGVNNDFNLYCAPGNVWRVYGGVPTFSSGAAATVRCFPFRATWPGVTFTGACAGAADFLIVAGP